jgi:NAD(P)H-dependent FMN reductase
MKLLILNGSPQGAAGNCAVLIRKIKKNFPHVQATSVDLQRSGFSPTLRKKIKAAEALLFITGTYWDSWGSPLQKFLEEATLLEAHPDILGKPAGVVVLMHSVGGKGVLSRLQGLLSSFGFLLPPLTGMVLSLVGQLALTRKSTQAEDFWNLQDLGVILKNLELATKNRWAWAAWPVDRKNFKKTWLK